ncbi:prolyl oligopeptidase [Psychromicrobium silvestre]|uniref:Prolyl oligopeptidase n=1 Tax=Psychromicrobium silvestre TaxID=1645614 RepID=A0A7Y9LUD5_9MICC|nr:prolyl oligopeptidase family serine peptidase [Psychromicrobium silvestre]NYE95785.1 prolyl oligopeptidase [Psychromicrobium silvestre]
MTLETDENLWLEDIYGQEQLDWVRERNARTEQKLLNGQYSALESRILEVLDSKDRIAAVAKRGEHYYNFWQDEQNPRGLWRRTSWDSYRSEIPEWETVLDIDALGAEEGTQWVWHGAVFLRPSKGEPHRRCLVMLSPDGGDAHVHREFDVLEKSFVPNGFTIPVAKSDASWQDADTLIVETDFGPGTLTTSSYPRTSRILRRGQALSDAELYFEVPEDHMGVFVRHDDTPGFERDIAMDVIDFFSRRSYLRVGEEWLALEVPEDVNINLHRQWLLLRPQSQATLGGFELRSGALYTILLEDFLAGSRDFTVIFEPDEHTSLQSWSWTKNFLLLELLQDVSSKILVADPAAGFARRELEGCPPLHLANISPVDEEDDGEGPEGAIGDDYWLTVTGFLTPSTLLRGSAAAEAGPAAKLKASPSFFKEADYAVEQHFATSLDGTKVPYFQVSPRDLSLAGDNPVLLSGYGGFEISRTPVYSGIIGRAWLERGGVYVVANIRGGGEYGPGWHLAALKENRHRAYQDFAAVAEDLIERGVTIRAKLACQGGSNGGLLVGNMLTQYPELFGAISCGVPLLDMQRYTKLNAGYSWIAEYGDPDVPEQWEYIKTFSPYHLLQDEVDYPPTFIWTATSDDRVGPVQARKMAARMERMNIEPLWFFESLEGGHKGAADNKQAARLQTAPLEFLWRALNGGEL